MKILIWGIPCVGKITVGKLLAQKLDYNFFDMNEIIKEKYGTIDNFHIKFKDDYDRYIEKARIALDVINNNENFVMVITLICSKEIVDRITSTDTISVELIDSAKSIYDRILFYDENDQLLEDSKEYRDEHKDYYMKVVRNDMWASLLEYGDIPKFNIDDRKLEDVIDDLKDYILKLKNERKS